MSLMKQTLGDIARQLPGATGVFHGFGLDFRCGGRQPLVALKADLMDHIHLENNILFERIDGQEATAHG